MAVVEKYGGPARENDMTDDEVVAAPMAGRQGRAARREREHTGRATSWRASAASSLVAVGKEYVLDTDDGPGRRPASSTAGRSDGGRLMFGGL